MNYTALESNPAALVRNNLRIPYNLDVLILKNLNSNLSDLKAQVLSHLRCFELYLECQTMTNGLVYEGTHRDLPVIGQVTS